MQLRVQPIGFREACAFVRLHHRHHSAPQGHKFSLAVTLNGLTVGVAIVGRPVARKLDDGLTLEVTRLCTDGTPNVASKLYSAARRAAAALCYRRVLTYTLDTEAGTSLLAAGWTPDGMTEGGGWGRPSRKRIDKHPTTVKRRWAAQAA